MPAFWKSKAPEPPEPAVPQFSIEEQRVLRAAACAKAWREIQDVQQQIREYETQNYAPAPGGGLAHRVTVGLVSNEQIDYGRLTLYQALARKVELHQSAMRCYAEVAP
jgi:hypothetical protein